MFKQYILIFLLLLPISVFSTQIDSLIELSKKYQSINIDSSANYALEVQALAIKHQDREAEVDAINLLATASIYKGDFAKFEELNVQALYCCQKYGLKDKRIYTLLIQSTLYRWTYAGEQTVRKINTAIDEILDKPQKEQFKFYPEMYEALGNILYYELNDSIVSLEYLHKAQHYYKLRGDIKKINSLYLNMGEIFRYNNRSDKARNYYKKAKEAAEKSNDSTMLGIYYRLRASLYLDKDNVATALQYLRQSEDIFWKINNLKQIADLYSLFSFAYSYVQDYNLSLEYNLKSMELREKIGIKQLLSSSYINVAAAYERVGLLDSALSYSTKAFLLADQIKHSFYLPKAMRRLSHIHSVQHNYKKSLEYLQKYIGLTDSLESEQINKVSLLEDKIRFNMIETFMQNKHTVSQLKNEKHTYKVFLLAIVILVFILIAVIIVLYKKYQILQNNHQS